MTPLRRGLWLGLCALALAGSGCNLLSLPFFLMGPDPSVPPKIQKIASDDKDKRVKVAVITSSNLEVRDQLSAVDRELNALVIKHLGELCKHNKEDVRVLPANAIEKYKSAHPDWKHPLRLESIGDDLHVDYVIYLEIDKLTLYMPKSSNQIYQGQSDIKVTLVNVHKPDDLPEEDLMHEEFPTSPISSFDEPNPLAFRHKFLDHVAQKIAWDFTAHPTEKDYGAE